MSRVLFVLLLVASQASAQDYPKAAVAGKSSAFTLYLPDDAKGFYRGTRFDRGGVIADWKVNGATLFHAWKSGQDAGNADDITGPCEEFDTAGPADYAAAKVGETFVKIGVGELRKDKAEPYQFMKTYPVVNPGQRTLTVVGGKYTFTHEIAAKSGVGYKLVKTVESADTDTAAVLKLRSTLTNTGTTPITTRVYNHNFFNVNRDPIGPNYRIDFAGKLRATKTESRYDELAGKGADALTFRGKLDAGQVYAEYADLPATPYRFTMRHAPSGTAVEVTSDRPLSAFRVWGISTVICPEPFIAIDDLQPGKSFAWATTYRVPLTK